MLGTAVMERAMGLVVVVVKGVVVIVMVVVVVVKEEVGWVVVVVVKGVGVGGSGGLVSDASRDGCDGRGNVSGRLSKVVVRMVMVVVKERIVGWVVVVVIEIMMEFA